MVIGSLKQLGDPDVTVELDTTTVAGTTVAIIAGTYNFDIRVPMLPTYKIAYQTLISVPLP